jgi:Domain of unknown function (DUF4276)
VSTAPVVAPIVEGHGEVSATRELITRIGSEFHQTWVDVAQPFRLDSGRMRKPDELAKAIRFQATRIQSRGGVLVLRDGDDKDIQCPVQLASEPSPQPGLVAVPVQTVIAFHEYEAWFLAAAESLRSHPSVRDDAHSPVDPESTRNAKGQLESLMRESYKETLHRAKFSALIDLAAAAEKSRSFRRLIHAIELLLD